MGNSALGSTPGGIELGTTPTSTGGGGGGVNSVSASSPLASSGGANPNITVATAIPVNKGGTGATTAAGARTNLGAGTGNGDALTSNPLSQFAATTSAQLAGVISDETGSGSVVFATSPTLVTPVLGVAAATSVNKVAITAPATSATLTIADGKTLTVSNTANVSGTNTGDQTNISGNAATVTTNANLTGPVTSTGNATAIGTGAITATMLADTAVTPGSYTSANITVDADGRITAAANGGSPVPVIKTRTTDGTLAFTGLTGDDANTVGYRITYKFKYGGSIPVVKLRFNADTGATNYTDLYLGGINAAPTTPLLNSTGPGSGITVNPPGTGTGSVWGTIDIMWPASGTKRTMVSHSGSQVDGETFDSIRMNSGHWVNTADQITEIDLDFQTGGGTFTLASAVLTTLTGA